MFKRSIWFSVGVVSGSLGSAWAYAKVRETRGRVAADGLVDTMADAAQRAGTAVREAMAEGRAAIAEAEARITAQLEVGGTRPGAATRRGTGDGGPDRAA